MFKKKYVSMLLIIFIPFLMSSGASSKGDTRDYWDVTYSKMADIENKIKKDYKNAKIIDKDFRYVPVRNILQNNFNIRFDVDLSCSLVATTMATHFYLVNSSHPEEVDRNDIFESALNFAVSEGYYNTQEGTQDGTVDRILHHTLEEYGMVNTTWYNYNKIFQGVKDFTTAANDGLVGKIQIFGVYKHDMIANGYLEVTFEYQTDWFWGLWSTTETKKLQYLIICDGNDNGFAALDATQDQIDAAYDYFELGTTEDYVVGVDFPERNWL